MGKASRDFLSQLAYKPCYKVTLYTLHYTAMHIIALSQGNYTECNPATRQSSVSWYAQNVSNPELHTETQPVPWVFLHSTYVMK